MSFPAADQRLRPTPQVPVLLFFAVSGMAAILQEVGWSELLSRFLGHGTAAVSVVAAAFLTGLATGAVWGGRLAANCAHPLALYGRLELAVASGAASMALFLPTALEGATRLLPAPSTNLMSLLPEALLAGISLIPVTVLMGASLPVLARTLASDATGAGQAAGRLNGINALGGALGALFALLLLPRWGTQASLLLAAAAQLLVGIAALGLSRRDSVPLPAEAIHQAPAHTPSNTAGLSPAVLLLAGAASLAAQVAWTRSFSWMLGSSVYTFALVLATTVAGLGWGSWMGGRLCHRSAHPRRLFSRLEALIAAAILLSIALLAGQAIPVAWLAAEFHHRPLTFQLAGLLLVSATLLPATFLMGAAFPAACRLAAQNAGVGRGIGRTAAWLTAGNVAGALLAGLLLPSLLGTRGVLLLAATAFALVAWFTAPTSVGRRLPAALLFALALWLTPSWEPALMAANPAALGTAYRAASLATGSGMADVMRSRGEFLFTAEGHDALVTVRRLPGGHASLQINGRTEASTGHDLPSQVLAAQIPLLYADHLRQALVVGLASGITTGSLLSRRPQQVTVAEIAPSVVDAAASGAFDETSGRPWDDPRVKILAVDARSLLLRDSRRYDLIASQPSHPWVAGVAGLYTVEFYRLVERRLTEPGVFGQWVQGYGLSLEDLRQIVRTFVTVFPHAVLYEEAVGGGDYFLVGSKLPLRESAALFLERLTPSVRAELRRAGVANAGDLLARRLLDGSGLRAFAETGALLRDDRLPLAYSAPLSRDISTVSQQSPVMEKLRRPRLDDLDLSGLTPIQMAELQHEITLAEAHRRQDRSFLTLLEADTFDHLATPEVSEIVAMVRAGLFRSAYGMLLEHLADTAGNAALQLLAGDLAGRLGEDELAAVHYRMVLEMRPDAASGSAGLGRVLLRGGDVEGALPHLQRAVQLDPEQADAWSNLGVALRRQGRLLQAEDAYRRALLLDPDLADTWYNLGRLFALTDRSGEATDALQQARRLAPGDCDTHQALARLQPDAPAPSPCP